MDRLVWATLLCDIGYYRDGLMFTQRRVFDDALRPPSLTRTDEMMAYPTAIYRVTAADFARAKLAVEGMGL